MDTKQLESVIDLGVELSILAKDKIICLTKDNNSIGIRIGIQGGGCSGFEYLCNLTETTTEFDTIFFKDTNHQVIIDAKSMFFLTGLIIDYRDGLTGAGFVFHNPSSTGTCGCGISFSM